MLGWVYERACDQAYAEILSEYLWVPIGAERDACITVDAYGAMRAAGGICVTPRDLARFGEMIRPAVSQMAGRWCRARGSTISTNAAIPTPGHVRNWPKYFRKQAIAANGIASIAIAAR